MSDPRPSSQPCCGEFAAVSRRGVLRGTALAGAVAAFGGAVVRTSTAFAAPGSSLAAAGTTPASSVLVVLSLRGAADGLSLVVPHADPAYYRARPRISIAASTLLAKDAMFGLHPSFAPLMPMWTAGKVAAVHATGLPAPNRSHFSAMEELEDAAPGSTVREGWLNRLLGQDTISHPLQGVGVGDGVVPTSLYGDQAVTTLRSPETLQLAGDDQWDTFKGRRRSVENLWASSRVSLGTGVRSALAAIDDFAPVKAVTATPANGAAYPGGDLGAALKHTARIIKGDVGAKIITVDQGDWDMHSDAGTLAWGGMKSNVAALASGIAALFTDLGTAGDKVTLVVLSEFGRRVRENDNYGTDHGYGNVMFLAGAGVRGGQYYGSWPGLTDVADADLLVTTDYRSVLSEVVTRRFGVSTAQVFPGFTPTRVGAMVGA